MRFTATDGTTFTDAVVCAQCGATSTDLTLTRCPADGSVLGERSFTDRELATMPTLTTTNQE